MPCEVDNIVATIETRVHGGILFAMDFSVTTKVELVVRSVNASSTRNSSSVVLDSVSEDFSGKTDGLQMTVSSRYNSNIKLDEIDETHGILRLRQMICRSVKKTSTGKHTFIRKRTVLVQQSSRPTFILLRLSAKRIVD